MRRTQYTESGAVSGKSRESDAWSFEAPPGEFRPTGDGAFRQRFCTSAAPPGLTRRFFALSSGGRCALSQKVTLLQHGQVVPEHHGRCDAKHSAEKCASDVRNPRIRRGERLPVKLDPCSAASRRRAEATLFTKHNASSGNAGCVVRGNGVVPVIRLGERCTAFDRAANLMGPSRLLRMSARVFETRASSR